MRWYPLKEGYQKRVVYVNFEHLTSIKFATGADGLPMAYMILTTGAEVTTHDPEDLDKLHKVLERNAA